MAVNLGLVMSLSKKEALKYSHVNITNIHMSEDKSALVFVLSDGNEISVPIAGINDESSKVFLGEGVPSIKADSDDLYIDKVNMKIYVYDKTQWKFLCDIGVSNQLINDITNLKSEVEKINKKMSKLNIGLKIIK